MRSRKMKIVRPSGTDGIIRGTTQRQSRSPGKYAAAQRSTRNGTNTHWIRFRSRSHGRGSGAAYFSDSVRSSGGIFCWPGPPAHTASPARYGPQPAYSSPSSPVVRRILARRENQRQYRGRTAAGVGGTLIARAAVHAIMWRTHRNRASRPIFQRSGWKIRTNFQARTVPGCIFRRPPAGHQSAR